MRVFVATHARLSLWIAMIPGFVVLIGGLSLFGSEAGLWLYALFAVWLLTAFVWINRQAHRLTKPAMEALDHRCDPQPLLDVCRTVLRQNSDSLYFRVHEAYALTLLGQEEEGRAAAERAARNRRLWKNPALALLWSACAAEEDPRQQTAVNTLKQAGQKLPPATREKLEQYLLRRRALQELGKAPEELEAPLLEGLEQAGCLREQVGAHLALGAYYCERKNLKAEEHLRFVLEHANRMRGTITQAERLLCLLPAPKQN